MSQQLAFDLPHRPALEADDFLVSDCNALAVRLIDCWPDWPHPVHCLVGPSGAGKSHLANVWRLKSQAALLPVGGLAAADIAAMPALAAVLVEDIDHGPIPETALFHFLNVCAEQRLTALFTARTPPAAWPATLPDLASRLRSLPVVGIGEPDDALLRAVLLKQFADRQLDVEPRVIEYLAARMDRSMAVAQVLVAALDREALATGRPITRRLAGMVLSRLQLPDEGA